VNGPGGARDALVHQRATEVVGAGFEAGGSAVATHLHPRCLDVFHHRMKSEAADRMHQYGFAISRPQPASPTQMNWRLHRHERQRHKFGKARCPSLQIAQPK
jgi:hypothetical protein